MTTLINIINSLNTAISLKKNKIIINKFNNLSLNILKILKDLNIIEFFKVSSNYKYCTVILNNITNNFYSSKLTIISKPSRYIYYSVNDLEKLRANDLFNDYIIYINNNNLVNNNSINNIVTIDDAIRLHKGGLVLIKIIKTL